MIVFMSRELEKLREKIDSADRELLEVLSKRMRLVEAIGELKRAEGLEIEDKARWDDLLHKRVSWAGGLHLSSELIRDIFELIHKAAIVLEKK
jgi:chorismate mutase